MSPNLSCKTITSRQIFLAKIIFILFAFANTASLFGQVYGCKDPLANNYDPSATINDGTCTYNTTTYTPPVLVDPMNATLMETSGLQMAGNSLWTFNDGGGAAAIYRIDTLSNSIFQTVNLSGATNVDWEDIAFDGTSFYVGDFGNNSNGARTDLKIYKFPFNVIPIDYVSNPTVNITAAQIEVINFSYSDQPLPITPTTPNNTKFDCEAMIIDGGQIHLFTKNWIDINTTHYVINSTTAGTYAATPLETLATGYLVTGADKPAGQNIVALLGYQASGTANHFMHLLSDYTGGNYFNGNKRRIDLPNATIMGQAEGIAFRDATYGYISNEKFTVGPLTVNQRLRSFDVTGFIPLYVLPLTLKKFNVTNENGTHKITWNFESIVHNVQLQYSTNGLNFSALKNYSTSIGGTFYNNTVNPFNYYRIKWQDDNTAIQFSNIISVKNEEKSYVGNFTLRANGELTFALRGDLRQNYSFKLISTDGRLLSEIAEESYSPGINKIYFSQKPVLSNLAYLVVYNNKQRVGTMALHVKR